MRAGQGRQPLDLWTAAPDRQLDQLVRGERARDRAPRAQPLVAPALVERCAAQRERLPQQAVLAELGERVNRALGAGVVPDGPERDVEAAVQGLAQKPTLCSCEASDR